ncbi:hypothetical protein [Methylobacterium segetis]|uniref:hypothetical protein n=1 Tax=Methylobacterium segetis TaxID=2488750 RepID=UPI00104B68F7|nr:hypothetical protein [Methylobacterium segetis]
MTTKTIALAAAMALSLTGAAWAQTAAGGGSAEGNMNSPGSVKSNSEKSMERATGSATGGTGGGAGAGATTGSTVGAGSPQSGGTAKSSGGAEGGTSVGRR